MSSNSFWISSSRSFSCYTFKNIYTLTGCNAFNSTSSILSKTSVIDSTALTIPIVIAMSRSIYFLPNISHSSMCHILSRLFHAFSHTSQFRLFSALFAKLFYAFLAIQTNTFFIRAFKVVNHTFLSSELIFSHITLASKFMQTALSDFHSLTKQLSHDFAFMLIILANGFNVSNRNACLGKDHQLIEVAITHTAYEFHIGNIITIIC